MIKVLILTPDSYQLSFFAQLDDSEVFHEGNHLPYGPVEAGQDRSGDDAVADTVLFDLWQGSESFHVHIIEAMPGTDAKP